MWRRPLNSTTLAAATHKGFGKVFEGIMMQRRRVEAESVTHNYYNSSTKPKFYKNTRLAGKIIKKISLTNFY